MEHLRKRAEELLSSTPVELHDKIDDVKRLIHELQVYQIELELQNAEIQSYVEKLKQTEYSFSMLFNKAPVAHFLFDNKGITKDCNQQACTLLATDKQNIVGKPMISFIGGGRKDDFFSFIEQVVKNNDTQRSEFEFFTKTNDIKKVEFFAVFIQQDNILATCIDVTEQRLKDEQLQQALVQTEKSNKLKTLFINTISHEIRTPLNAIVGFSNLICMPTNTSEKQNRYAQYIEKSSRQLINIIEDILLVSKLNNNDVPFTTSKIYVNKLLSNLYQFFTQKYINSSSVLEVKYPDNDIIIESDMSKLENVLQRLIENSFKYTENGVISISCSVKNNQVIFAVTDNGIGISKQHQSALFEPFHHSDSTDFFQSGLGLGLAISKRYTQLLGGNIWFEPNEPNGASFFVSLPLPQSSAPTSSDATNQNVNRLAGKTMLIAEDEIANFTLLSEIFTPCGVNVMYAAHGKMAVDLCLQHRFDIVLMDINMPRMNGIDATKIIRQQYPNILIVAVTAYNDINQSVDTTQLFNTFIFKPIDITAAINTINNLL